MNKDLSRISKRDFLKAIGTEHLNAEEIQLFRERGLDEDTMSWAIVHISECHSCCSLVPVLSAEEISDALAGTPYGRPDYVSQILEYYIETLEEVDALKKHNAQENDLLDEIKKIKASLQQIDFTIITLETSWKETKGEEIVSEGNVLHQLRISRSQMRSLLKEKKEKLRAMREARNNN